MHFSFKHIFHHTTLTCFAATTILSLAACVTSGTNPPSTETTASSTILADEPGRTTPVRVTMLLPLSGKDEKLGEALQNAATLAMGDLGYPAFELVFEDTASSTDGAAAAATKSITAKTNMILGPVFADDVRRIRQIVGTTPVITFSTDMSVAGHGTYLIGILPVDQARQMGEFTQARGLKNVLIIAPQDLYGQLTARAFSDAAQAQGVSILEPLWLKTNDESIESRLKTILKSNPTGKPIDGIFMPLPADQAARLTDLVIRNTPAMTPTPIMMGTGLWDDIAINKYPSLNGAYYAAPARQARSAFEQNYANQFGVKPPRLASIAYDSVALALTLGRQIGPSGFSADHLTRRNGFAGTNGLFRFNLNGQNERELPVLQLQSTTATIVTPAIPNFMTN